MNLRLIPTPNEAVAQALSRALWGLSRPESIRAPGEVSEAWCVMRVDALGQFYVMVDTEESIPVHAEAVLVGTADILQPWIDAGHLPADTNTQLAALVESKRGQQLLVYDAFPQLFKDMSKTHEEMITAGLLAAPQTP